MMNLAELELPEVAKLKAKARFFKNGERDFIEISYVGSKDTMVRKVEAKHMAEYRDEWNAFCDGTPLKLRIGTPLTELQDVDEQRAEHFINQNVHTLEEISVLSDAQCQALGHGTMTLRKQARDILMTRQAMRTEDARKKVIDASAALGPRPAEQYASVSDLTAVQQSVADLKTEMGGKLDAVLQALTAKKPGRPKKPKDETPQ